MPTNQALKPTVPARGEIVATRHGKPTGVLIGEALDIHPFKLSLWRKQVRVGDQGKGACSIRRPELCAVTFSQKVTFSYR